MQMLDTIKRRVMARVGKGLAPQVTDEELEQAINDAIDEVRTEMPYHVDPDETTVTLSEDTYEYDISGVGMDYIYRVTMADADGDFPTTNIVWPYQYRIIAGPKLVFDERMWTPLDSRKLRIEGQAFQDSLSAGDDVLYISDAYVVNKAAAILLGNLGSPREASAHRLAEDARQRSSFLPFPDAQRVRN